MIESSSNISNLHISQFVKNIAIGESDMLSTLLTCSHDNRCVISYKLCNYRFPSITRPDQITTTLRSAYSKFFSSRSLSTVTPFASRCLLNLSCSKVTPLNSLLSLTISHSTRLNLLLPGAFAAKKNASRSFSTNYLTERFIVFSYLGFS